MSRRETNRRPKTECSSITRPRGLKAGGTIGVAAPASPFDPGELQQGVVLVERRGFKVALADAVFSRNGYLAGSDRQRAALLTDLFTDPAIDAVFCARGGFGSIRVLPLLDYSRIGRHPKILVGYSDVTALLVALHCRCRFVTFHGPMLSTLPSADDESVEALFEVLAGYHPVDYRFAKPVNLMPGKASGPVLAGNLTTLCHLTGTPFQPVYDGCILVIEDRGEAPYRLDRMLNHLKLAGCLDRIAGLVIGSFEDCGSASALFDIVLSLFAESPIPIAAGLAFGHGRSNLTLPIGLAATLDADRGRLTYRLPATVNPNEGPAKIS
jgi:muramoyltetrapeptide carboxypeptidase